MMAYASLACFLLGLILAVRAMLVGVERPGNARRTSDASPRPSPRFALNLPTIAGFATAFGLAGYLLSTYTSLGVIADLAIAAAAGAVGAVGALTLVTRWAIPAAKAEVVDERYVMQGAFARVLDVSDGGASGTVRYEAEGASHTTRAAPLDGARLEVGAEVVIERIEDGIAYVEPWSRVEARL